MKHKSMECGYDFVMCFKRIYQVEMLRRRLASLLGDGECFSFFNFHFFFPSWWVETLD